MNYMFSDIFRLDPLQRSLIVAILYMIPLKKRKNYWRNLGSGIAVCLLCAPLIRIYTRWSVQTFRYELFEKSPYLFLLQTFLKTTADLLQYLVLVTLIFYFCCNIRKKSAVYGATCAYLTQDLAYTIFVFLMPEYVHQSRDSLNFTALAGKVLVMVIVYSLIYLFFAKKIVLNGEYPLNSTSSLGMMLGIIAAGKTLGSCARISYDVQQSFYFNIILLYDLLVTFAVLVLEMILRREEIYKMKIESEKSFREAQYRQYQLFRSNITSINHKCHDLKHMISALRAEKDVNNQEERLKELESSVMIYESQMNTGNKNLDAILTNTCMQCNQKNIQWTCMAEGQILDFMDALDMYIMLGNALDNAVENLETIADPECRFLVVNIWKKGALAFIKIENYCEKQVEFLNGIPQTTKEDVQEHGFGSRSIRDIVEKYHGELKISLSHNIFAVNIMMPANIT